MALARDRPFFKLAVVALLLGYSFAEGNCGSHLKSSSGTIQSPSYPKPYPAGQECTWTVSVDGSVENIRISFSAFNLQPRNNAGDCVDYVAIYRLLLNKDAEAVMEGKFCGDSIPSPISIGQSSMTVQFISGPVSTSYTGFSLHYTANFKDTAKISQATAGIVAAIFCAVVFIGVGMLRCIMMGACGNTCNAQNAANTRDRQVVGTSESYAYQADFPPSYSTVMDHPERFPTPESSPQILLQRNGTVTEGSLTPSQDRLERTFTLQSSDSETSDDEDTPPPPYPGNGSSEDLVAVVIASNDTNERDGLSNTGSHNLGIITEERELTVTEGFPEVPSVEMIMSVEDEPRLSASSPHEALSSVGGSSDVVRDNSPSREAAELSQTGELRDDDREEVII